MREMAKAIEIATRMAESAARDNVRISTSFIPMNPELPRNDPNGRVGDGPRKKGPGEGLGLSGDFGEDSVQCINGS